MWRRLSLFILFLISPSAWAAPGDLDPLFGTEGLVHTTFTGSDTRGFPVEEIALQSDGKIVVVGTVSRTVGCFNDGNGWIWKDMAVARFNADGTLDTTFGDQGKVTLNFGEPELKQNGTQCSVTSGRSSIATGVVIQDDGKIIVGGFVDVQVDLYENFAVARLNTDGTLDNSFGASGLVTDSFSGAKMPTNVNQHKLNDGRWNQAYDLAFQPDGKILLVGWTNYSPAGTYAFARLNEDGKLDTTFSGDGRAIFAFSSTNEIATAVTLQPDGKIVGVGGGDSNGNGIDYHLIRLLSDGKPDLSFDSDGSVYIDINNQSYDVPKDVVIQSDGKIVVMGSYSGGGMQGISLARLGDDGGLDSSFDSDGIVKTPKVAEILSGNAVTLQPDGKILVAGRFDADSPQQDDFLLFRYNSDGSLDPTFSGDGKVRTDFVWEGSSKGDDGRAIVFQGDGGILVAGLSVSVVNVGPSGSPSLAKYRSGLYELSVDDISAIETDSVFDDIGPETFTVTLSTARSMAVTVDYEIRDGSTTAGDDYIAEGAVLTGTVSFAPGETSKTVSVWISGDLLVEGEESFEIELSNPVNATIVDSIGSGTIIDNDSGPEIRVNDIAIPEPGEGGQATGTFTITLSRPSEQTVTVDYNEDYNDAVPGVDFESFNGTVTFDPGETVKTVSVAVWGDAIDEEDEVFFIYLAGAVNATVADDFGDAVIQDSSPEPTLSINDLTFDEVDDSVAFTVSLSEPSARYVRFRVTTNGINAMEDVDFLARDFVQSIEPGETSVPVYIPILDGSIPESDEVFEVVLSEPLHATISDDRGVATIRDNDGPLPTLSISDASGGETEDPLEATRTLAFTVTLSQPHEETVMVDYETVDGTALVTFDYAPAIGQLVFSPGETNKTITVPVLDDIVSMIFGILPEEAETFSIRLTNPFNATIADGEGIGTITDNDGTRTLTVTNASASESDGTIIFTATVSETSLSDVRFRWEAVTDGTARMALDFAPDLGEIRIESGETSATFSIELVDDEIEEEMESFTVRILDVENANLTGSIVTATITDDDGEPEPVCGDGTCAPSEEGVCAEDCDGGDETIETQEECVVIATNFLTGEECGRVTIREGEAFAIECDPLKIADPDQRSKLRVAIQAYCQTVTYGMFYETDYDEQQFEDGEEEVQAGEIDTEQTIALEMLKDHLDENGMQTIRDFEPACFVSFMDRFYTSASREVTTIEGGMGAAKDVVKCLIKENLSPSLYGFSSYQDLISAIREGSLSSETIESLSQDVESHCDYNATIIRARLDQAQEVTRRIAQFAATGLCDEGEVFEKMKEDSGWIDAAVQTVQSLSDNHLQNGDRAFEIVEDLIEEGMEEEEPALFTNEMNQHVLLGVIEQAMEVDFSRGHFDAALELVGELSLEEGELSDEQLQELGDLFINIAPEVHDHLEDSEDAWLIANYLADSVGDGEMDQESEDELLSDPDEFLDELDRHDESVRECRRGRGAGNGDGGERDCLDDIDPVDQLLDDADTTPTPPAPQPSPPAGNDDEGEGRRGPPEGRGRP
ncbi:MAG: hypothetical protein HYT76_09155 [Deltaproteobacteria bacterium]|nr:hypothetical protein [Deltaproteobacteria bacterium]